MTELRRFSADFRELGRTLPDGTQGCGEQSGISNDGPLRVKIISRRKLST
jgi:hypothetical protein